MLCKLAWGNVRRASRDYLVYLLTLVLAVTVFYAFNTIAVQVDLAGVENEGMADLLGSMIAGLTVFLGFIMGFLMVYANGYIMKRRKKEFGLYQVLGMSRGQVARVMALETFIVSGVALVIGLVCGVILSQIMVFFTASLFKTQIADFHFFISPSALITTAGCLVLIFLVTLALNLRVVARARVIDLMDAGRKNETIKIRSPWISAIIFILGAAAIGVAYHRLLRDGLPYDGSTEGMQVFAMTTGIVIVGTVLFFYGLSGFLLKLLQLLRGAYWRGLNMVTLRQLSAKVNTVSFSMAIISMILFLAITSVTTGMSLAGVMTNNLEVHNPADFSRAMVYFSASLAEDFNSSPDEGAGKHYGAATEPIDMMEASANDVLGGDAGEQRPFDLASIAGESVQMTVYDSRSSATNEPYITLIDLCRIADAPVPAGVIDGDAASQQVSMGVMSESDYNAFLRFIGKEPIDLGEDGYTITSDMGSSLNDIYNAVLSGGKSIELDGRELKPVQGKVDESASSFSNSLMGSNTGTIIVPDDVIEKMDMPLYWGYLLVNYADGVSVEEGDAYVQQFRKYSPIYGAGASAEGGDIVGAWGTEGTRTSSYESSNSMNGLISYLSIYIGFVLVVACAAILTIQQLSSVADAAKNYRILAELGTSEREISRSMLVQQLVFFVFPLVVAAAHSLVALKVIIDLVALFGGLSIASTAILVTVIFLLSYGGYFALCFFMSKGIVRDAIRVRHSA